MKTTEYLYDISPNILIGMEYKRAIEFKIKCSKELLYYLVHVKNDPYSMRTKEVYKAIEFNKKLLEELE